MDRDIIQYFVELGASLKQRVLRKLRHRVMSVYTFVRRRPEKEYIETYIAFNDIVNVLETKGNLDGALQNLSK